MSVEGNKRVVRGQIEAITRGDYEAMRRYLAEDFINHNPPPGQPERGLQAAQDAIRMLHSAFRDYRVEILDLIGEGDRVCTRATVSGTHTGPFLGNEATGRKASVESLMLFRLENGKVVERWAQLDLMAMIQQLGIRPPLQQAA